MYDESAQLRHQYLSICKIAFVVPSAMVDVTGCTNWQDITYVISIVNHHHK